MVEKEEVKNETPETPNGEVEETNVPLDKLFVDLQEGVPTDEIESLCMECEKNGVTRFMYTKIPMFKEIILSSFLCEHCGNKNSEVQFGGKLEKKGVKYTQTVTEPGMLNRSAVKSEFATIKIPELGFEIPAQTQKGSINTIEGFFANSIEGLSAMQPERRKYDPITAAKIDEFIAKLVSHKEGKTLPFTFEVTDPSGNSFIQNPNYPAIDPTLKVEQFERSLEEYATMGYNVDEAAEAMKQEAAEAQLNAQTMKEIVALDGQVQDNKMVESTKAVAQSKEEQEELIAKLAAFSKKDEITAAGIDFSKPLDQQKGDELDDVKKEVMCFASVCDACNAQGECKMCIASIPYFSEIIVMAFSCIECGHRSSEIKHGGGMSDKATKIVFTALGERDLHRDVFKSDSCELSIPEVGLEMSPGTQGSMYTTMEGLFDQTITHLKKANPFGSGDSKESKDFLAFIDKLTDYKDGKVFPFTIILDDPLSNCFIYNANAPEDCPQTKITVYERTHEQNEELGINQMNV